MHRLIILIYLLLTPLLFGEDNSSLVTSGNSPSQNELENIKSKNAYIKYLKLPERVYKGQIFSVTLKLTVISENFDEVIYRFIGGTGAKLLSNKPDRTLIDDNGVVYAEDKFYFKATSTRVILPRVDVYMESSLDIGKEDSASGRRLDMVIELPTSQNFSHIFAKKVNIDKVVADKYDEKYNILTMFISAEMSDLSDIHFLEPYIKKQGIQSKHDMNNFKHGKVIYYVVLPKYYDNFIFKYFNTDSFNFQKINIPFEVKNDMVSTAKDLRPKTLDQNRKIKIAIFIGITIIFLALFYFYQHWINIIFASLSTLIAVSFLLPKPSVCVKNGAIIRILPMETSTGFNKVEGMTYYEKIAERGEFVKVRLSESSEGWVNVKNVCKEN